MYYKKFCLLLRYTDAHGEYGLYSWPPGRDNEPYKWYITGSGWRIETDAGLLFSDSNTGTLEKNIIDDNDNCYHNYHD
jgi:hypothetical protein